jgi:Ca2+-binding RTX toxin-like protein
VKNFEMLELESRRHFSASAHIDAGVLHVDGDKFVRNTIVVGNTADGLSVDVSIHSGLKTFHSTFLLSTPITSLFIRGGFARDTITIDSTNSAFALPTIIDGRFGNDTITASDEDDTIIGGFGNDIINAGEGTNIVRGGFGNDVITTGSGNDKIDGNFGNDMITSGGGSDTVAGGFGNDVIDSGAGSDLVFGGRGNDNISGNNGNDTLWGGAGNDIINGNAGNDTLGGVLGHNSLIGGAGADTFRVTDLTRNPSNDYDTAQDTLINVHDDDGGDAPVI